MVSANVCDLFHALCTRQPLLFWWNIFICARPAGSCSPLPSCVVPPAKTRQGRATSPLLCAATSAAAARTRPPSAHSAVACSVVRG
jgi:hypothetical protein